MAEYVRTYTCPICGGMPNEKDNCRYCAGIGSVPGYSGLTVDSLEEFKAKGIEVKPYEILGKPIHPELFNSFIWGLLYHHRDRKGQRLGQLFYNEFYVGDEELFYCDDRDFPRLVVPCIYSGDDVKETVDWGKLMLLVGVDPAGKRWSSLYGPQAEPSKTSVTAP